MNRYFDGFQARFARPEEADAVYAFYDTPQRTEAVYLRNREIITEQVNNGRFFIVTQNNQIVAASTFYQLNAGDKTDCIKDDGRVVERGAVAELGSVLKWGIQANKNGEVPKDFFHPLLFAVPMLEAFRRAGEDVCLDLLVANVQPELVDNINRLTQGGRRSPHRWELIKPAPALLQAFHATTTDPNAARNKLYFRASVNNLPDVAKYLLDSHEAGGLSNHHGDILKIDMSALPLDTYRAIQENKKFFRSLPPNMSWQESRRIFEPSMPTDGAHRPARPANGWGQHSRPHHGKLVTARAA